MVASHTTHVSSTYRLQFHRGFTLRDAIEIVPYLAELGVSHIYASPLLTARQGSLHGYDVCDPTRINPEIGSESDFSKLTEALRENGMGLVLDIVPNHMSASPENPWFWDILQHGRSSRFAAYFDIDWEMQDPVFRNKVILPVLGDEFEQVLRRGELRLESGSSGVVVRYFSHQFPLSPESVGKLGPTPEIALPDLNANVQELSRLLDQQHYRLVFWRRGDQLLNYRRFFNISDLAGLRVEDPDVFTAAHSHVFEWFRAGLLDGLRIDHPDGLYDPEQYFKDLRKETPEAWIVIEKILTDSENLPVQWPVQGTTGYDFLNRLSGLFIDAASEPALTAFYAEFAGERNDFETVALSKKRLVLRDLFGAELSRLLDLFEPFLEGESLAGSFDKSQTQEAVIELAAGFEVYRTYIQAEAGLASGTDRRYVEQAAARARRHRPELAALLHLLCDLLLLRKKGSGSAEFVMRFQQLTGPVMAKGVEDTAFYCYNRFVMLNEVGGNPAEFGLGLAAFHDDCVNASRQWPLSMLATSTHDTKRSEDVRARLALLSEIPDQWISRVRLWSAMLEKHRSKGLPDRNVEYLFYQTLVGAWPLSSDRALAYLQKAAREAKEHTSWNNPDPLYEGALEHFVRRALDDRDFLTDLEQFIAPLIDPGQINSLAQTLIKLTAPGVPDMYQGTELWDLSLVDPDNRRAVDFKLRRRLLEVVKALPAESVWQRRGEGLPKLWLICRTLSFRAQRAEAFASGSTYEPLMAEGTRARHVMAYVRGGKVVSITPRLLIGLKRDWVDTVLSLPPGLWQNEFTAEVVRGRVFLQELLARFPVGLLSRTDG